MGYPMTYKRVVNRNGLAKGGYEHANDPGPKGLSNICGDLRRLEADATDDNWIAQLITDKTGVDRTTVTAVLKAFFEA